MKTPCSNQTRIDLRSRFATVYTPPGAFLCPCHLVFFPSVVSCTTRRYLCFNSLLSAPGDDLKFGDRTATQSIARTQEYRAIRFEKRRQTVWYSGEGYELVVYQWCSYRQDSTNAIDRMWMPRRFLDHLRYWTLRVGCPNASRGFAY